MSTRVLSVSEVRRLIRQSPQIPSCKRDGVEVRHRPSRSEEVVNARKSMMLGMKPLSMDFDPPLDVQELRIDHNLWMTTRPCELWQMRDGVEELYGHALIGGLGLGVATTWAARRPNVRSVTTVELDPRVVDLVWPHLPNPPRSKRSTILVADLFEHLRSLRSSDAYDSAFYDIWAGTGEMTWVEHIVPLLRLSRDKVEFVECWLEGEMRAQIAKSCVQAFGLDDSVSCWWPHDVFRQACRRAGMHPAQAIGLDVLNAATNDLKALAAMAPLLVPDLDAFLKSEAGEYLRLFLSPGLEDWDLEFGSLWDELRTRYEGRSRPRKAPPLVGPGAPVAFACQIGM